MKISVYKGFDQDFLENLKQKPLVDTPVIDKIQVSKFDKSYSRKLRRSLLDVDEMNANESNVWMSYQEFLLVKEQVLEGYHYHEYDLEIFNNNLYLGYSQITDQLPDKVWEELFDSPAGRKVTNSENNSVLLQYYSDFYRAGDAIFGYFRPVDDKLSEIIKNYYPGDIVISNTDYPAVDHIYLNDDLENFLTFVSRKMEPYPEYVSYQNAETPMAKRMLEALKAWAVLHSVKLENLLEETSDTIPVSKELLEIAKNDLHIPGFSNFRELTFYKKPELNNETIEITQGQIISEIIEQSEISYEGDETARDIFITAPTGSGKSLMFQVPAVYLARNYGKLTLVIEPIKALMQDQIDQLKQRGYNRVETFNSDLISQNEKEEVLRRIKKGEVDLLYVSPETLLSYSIQTLIGDREIGLIIVDEAHIVTTWGMDFRPDYWYLGKFIKRIRSGKRHGHKIQNGSVNCIVCAFTATAVNGGPNDSVNDIINSLSMENPIKHLGFVQRNNIQFKIINHSKETDKSDKYPSKKNTEFKKQISQFIDTGQKTIVYFPFRSLLMEAQNGTKDFAGAGYDSNRIAMYAGSFSYSTEADKKIKKESFEDFRSGKRPIMFATKAFGMGVDIKDIQNVYHYAPTGGLSDYIQEIGRAARKDDMTGYAIIDYFRKDLKFSRQLRSLSQIRAYQLMQVLSDLYEVYRSKGEKRNFLISPESFTYIFGGKNDNEDQSINKLKIALMMLEKDLYDKNSYKILITNPRSVFTVAYVVIDRKIEKNLLCSQYGKFFKKIANGRFEDKCFQNGHISDCGDIYEVDLKGIWERYYPNISFPQFKYFFLQKFMDCKNGEKFGEYKVLPQYLDGIYQRQMVDIINKKGESLKDVLEDLSRDFEYLSQVLSQNFKDQYFTKKQFAAAISSRFGRAGSELIISSLFSILEPDGFIRHIKSRSAAKTSETEYLLSGSKLMQLFASLLSNSQLRFLLQRTTANRVKSFIRLNGEKDGQLLKLLSLFGYVTYNVSGGTQPEIFVRFNSPEKIRAIVTGEISYSNQYLTKQRERGERDRKLLRHFFETDYSNEERWNLIERYFLGEDIHPD